MFSISNKKIDNNVNIDLKIDFFLLFVKRSQGLFKIIKYEINFYKACKNSEFLESFYTHIIKDYNKIKLIEIIYIKLKELINNLLMIIFKRLKVYHIQKL